MAVAILLDALNVNLMYWRFVNCYRFIIKL